MRSRPKQGQTNKKDGAVSSSCSGIVLRGLLFAVKITTGEAKRRLSRHQQGTAVCTDGKEKKDRTENKTTQMAPTTQCTLFGDG